MKKIKNIKAEKVLQSGKQNWGISYSIKKAEEKAKRKQIYKTGSGAYVWRK